MSKNSPSRLLDLDALRGFAAIAVVLFHYTMGIKQLEKFHFNLGQTGVDLFFLISGFVIFMTLNKVKSGTDFIKGRFARLYPTYWFCVTYTAIAILISTPQILNLKFGWQYLTNMTMFQTYLFQGDLDGVYWTMIVEMLFYITLMMVYKLKLIKNIELLGFIALLPLVIYGSYLTYHVNHLENRVGRFLSLINFVPLFLSGIVFYKLKFEQKSIFRYILLLLCYLTQLTLIHAVEIRSNWISIYEYGFMLGLYYVIFLIYSHKGLGLMVNSVTIFLGQISFPLYLSHNTVTRLFAETFHKALPFWPAKLCLFSLSILIAYLIHKFIELPSNIYLKKLFSITKEPKSRVLDQVASL